MTYQLSTEEKINIVVDHLKTLEMNKYDLQVSLIECQSSQEDQSANVESLNFQIYEINLKQDVLSKELADLNREMGNI